jgi:hypothetical protein
MPTRVPLVRGARQAPRQQVRGAGDHVVEGDLGFAIEGRAARDDLFEGVLLSEALLLQDAAQLRIEAREATPAQALEHVVDRSSAIDAFARVVPVPAGTRHDERPAEEQGAGAHLGDQHAGAQDAPDLQPGVGGSAVARVVGVDAALPHHDHGDAHEREEGELKRAGELGDPRRIEEHQNGHDRGDRQDDGLPRDPPATEPAQVRGQQVIAAHRQR